MTIWVKLNDGRTVGVPLAWFPRLLHATPAEREQCRIGATGQGLHWEELYPGLLDLGQEFSVQLQSGLGMGTNHSISTISNIVEMACGDAEFRFGKDLIVNLGK